MTNDVDESFQKKKDLIARRNMRLLKLFNINKENMESKKNGIL